MRKLGEIILKSRIPLIIIILAISSVFLLFIPQIEMRDDETVWFSEDDPALLNYHRFEDLFGSDDFILVAYESADPFSKSEIAYLSGLTEKLEQVPYIEEATSLTTVDEVAGFGNDLIVKPLIEEKDAPKTEAQRSRLEAKISSNPFIDGTLISGDGKTVGIILELGDVGLDSDITQGITNSIEEILAEEREVTGREYYFGGGIISDSKMTEVMLSDMRLFTPLSFAIAALLLFVIFRNLACVIFPLLSVFLSLLWTFGLKAMVGSPVTPVSSALIALITLIGVASSVHLISHYQVELSRGKDRKEAILSTYGRAGTPCFFTSLTTAAGFGSLAISSIPLVRSLGIFASFGIMSVFLLSMIIVPIGLQVAKRLKKAESRSVTRWESIGRFSIANSKMLIILGLLLSIVMGLGSLNISTEASMLQYFKQNSTIRQSADFLDEKLSGTSSIEVVIVGNSGSFKKTEVLREIEHLQRSVENYPGVSCSLSMVDYFKLINGTLSAQGSGYTGIPATKREVDWAFRFYEHSEDTDIEDYYVEGYWDIARVSIRTKQMNEEQREKLIEEIEDFASKNLEEFKVVITGFDSLIWKITNDIVKTQVQGLGLALLVILGLMAVLFGPRGGLASILPNILPIAFVFGLMG